MEQNEVQSDTGGIAGVQSDRALGLPTRSQIRELEVACRERRLTAIERDKAITTLTRTLDLAKSWRLRIAASRALAGFESNELRDLHHTERMRHEDGILDLRMRRAEEGKPNDSLLVQVAPVEQLPEPEWLTKRRKLLDPSAS